MAIPADYLERVYAGVLGKIIGVYLGRPFEGWSYEAISKHLGEINYYVHDRLGTPLIVTDDDISGTFTFIRALEDYGYNRDITPAQIGETWLNYLVEEQTVLWWGGMGNSTEHTAYLRLKEGIKPPLSGSVELNGKVVAEQIGAQIFIDGWALVAPGDPEYAADLAYRAGQRQPRRRSDLWRAMSGRHGSASFRRVRHQQADRHRHLSDPQRLDHLRHDQ